MNTTLKYTALWFFALFIFLGIIILYKDTFSSFLPHFIEGLGAFSGTFLGVVAGIFVAYTIQSIEKHQTKKQRIKNFVAELQINKIKLEDWLSQLKDYRNAVNGDCLHNFYCYFNLSSHVGISAYDLHVSGEVYNILSHDEFLEIQKVYNELGYGWEQHLNNQIDQNRALFTRIKVTGDIKDWSNYNKPDVIGQINFWEDKFSNAITILNNIIVKLQKV